MLKLKRILCTALVLALVMTVFPAGVLATGVSGGEADADVSAASMICTVTFDANGGTGEVEALSGAVGTSCTISYSCPEKLGYNFTGWSTTASGKVEYKPSDAYCITGDATLYALWEEAGTITADTGEDIEVLIPFAGQKTYKKFVPTKTAVYIFEGADDGLDNYIDLYSQEGTLIACNDDYFNDSYRFYLAAELEKDVVYYVRIGAYGPGSDRSTSFSLISSCTVRYDAGDGSGAPAAAAVSPGENYTIPAISPTLEGYAFAGWATSTDAAKAEYQPGDSITVTGDIVLYAVWTGADYTVTFDANGGAFDIEYQYKSKGVYLTITELTPTRPGCGFEGWATSADAAKAEYQPGDTYSDDKSVTLYAVWQMPEEIVFTSDAVSRTASITKPGEKKFYVLKPAADVLVGIRSTGADDDCIYLYDSDGSELDYNDDGSDGGLQFNLYAELTGGEIYYIEVGMLDDEKIGEIPFTVSRAYTVSYDANGGDGEFESVYVYEGGSAVMPEEKPSLYGKYFAGWAENPSKPAAGYMPGDAVAISADTTLYAVWADSYYTVSYDANGGSINLEDGYSQYKYKGVGMVVTDMVAYHVNQPLNFAGWATSADAAKAEYQPGDVYTADGDAVLYAVWEECSTISVTTSADITADIPGKMGTVHYKFVPAVTAEYYFFSTGSKDDYIYIKDSNMEEVASNDDADGLQFALQTELTAGKTYYIGVYFTLNNQTGSSIPFTVARGYNITFDAHGGYYGPSPIVKSHGIDITLPKQAPEKQGEKFLGWSTQPDGEVLYQPGDTYSVDADGILYAVWQTAIEITTQPADVFAPDGSVVSVEVEAVSNLEPASELSYQWYYANAGIEDFERSSIKTSVYSVTMNASRNGRRIYCLVTDAEGNMAASDVVTIRMAETVSVVGSDILTSVTRGEYVSLTVEAEGEDVTYQWYIADPGSDKFYKSSIKTDTYTAYMNNARHGRQVYCVVTDKYGCTDRTEVYTLCLLPEVNEVSAVTSAAEGEKVSITVEADGIGGFTYQWYVAMAGTDKFSKSSIKTATYSTTMDASRDGRQVYCVVTDSEGNQAISETYTITLEKSELTITEQPEHVTAANGAKATVTVAAEGEGLTYKWYIAAPGSSKFSKSSITTAAYSVTMNESRDGRQIYCVVTDKYGQTVTSDVVTINMAKAPEITQQPADVSAPSGETVSILVIAEGEGLTYQWYYANPGSDNFSKSSVASDTYTTKMSASRDGRRVYCVITDAYGQTVTSDVATLTVGTALLITQQPVNITVAEGEKATVCVLAEGEGLTYQWYIAAPGSTKFSKSSTTSYTYSVTMNESRNGRQLYCVITDANGSSMITDIVTIGMASVALAITEQPVSVTVAAGEKAAVSVSAVGEGLCYEWYIAAPGSSKFSKSSTTSYTYSVTMNESRDGRQLYCVVSDQYGNARMSDIVTINMSKTVLMITPQPPESVGVHEGETVKVEINAKGDGLSYQWYVAMAGSDTFSKSSVKTATYSTVMTAEKSGRRVYCVVTDKYGQSVTSDITTIYAQDLLAIITQPQSAAAAEGEKATVYVTAGGEDISYEWYIAAPGSSKFSKSSTTGPAYSVTMNESRDGRRLYCVITDAAGNTVKSNTVTINMY